MSNAQQQNHEGEALTLPSPSTLDIPGSTSCRLNSHRIAFGVGQWSVENAATLLRWLRRGKPAASTVEAKAGRMTVAAAGGRGVGGNERFRRSETAATGMHAAFRFVPDFQMNDERQCMINRGH